MLNSKSQMEKSLHVIVPRISAMHFSEGTTQRGKEKENKRQHSNTFMVHYKTNNLPWINRSLSFHLRKDILYHFS